MSRPSSSIQSESTYDQAQQQQRRDFDAWKKQVDSVLLSICGLSGDDLADVDYYSMFENDYSPKDAALYVLEENDFPFDE